MELESLYERKKGSHSHHYSPGSTLPPAPPHSPAKCLESLHCLPLNPFFNLLNLTPPPHFWDCFEWPSCYHILTPFFCTYYPKYLTLLNTSFLEDVLQPYCCLALETQYLSPSSLCLCCSLWCVFSSFHLSPSPSEDFPKGSAHGRSHLFLNCAGYDLLSLELQLSLLFIFLLLHSLPPQILVKEHQALFKAVGTLWGIRGKASVLKELP